MVGEYGPRSIGTKTQVVPEITVHDATYALPQKKLTQKCAKRVLSTAMTLNMNTSPVDEHL